MKVVINKCYGGFGLSHQAVMEYAKRKGMTLYAYAHPQTGCGYDWDKYILIDQTVKNDDVSIMAPDQQDSIVVLNEYSGHVIHYSTNRILENGTFPPNSYFDYYDIKRDDPDLVAVVEELGEVADGFCSKLKIVEIPDGTDWAISNYDGMESVYETHRSWH